MLAAQVQRDHDAAGAAFTTNLDGLRRNVETIIEPRDRAFRALAHEGTGMQRLAALAQVSRLPFTAVFDGTSGTWKVTYAFGSRSGSA